jgi:hypothetical protein
LSAGGLTAYALGQDGFVKIFETKWVRSLLSVIGVIALIFSINTIDRTRSYPDWWALGPVIAALCLILSGPNTNFSNKILGSKPFVWVGLISYPLYLWHWPILAFAKITEFQLSHENRIGLVALSFALAWATYILIEKPVKSAHSIAKRWITIILIGVSVSIMFGGLFVIHNKGFPVRNGFELVVDMSWPPMNDEKYQDQKDAKYIFSNEFIKDRDFYHTPGQLNSNAIAVIGDSHANRIYQVFVNFAFVNVINIGRGFCLPILDIETLLEGGQTCQPLVNNMLAFVANSSEIDRVVIAAYYTSYLDGRVPIRNIKINQDADVIFEKQLVATITYLEAHHKKVYLIIDVPELSFDPKDCINGPYRFQEKRATCSIGKSEYEAKSAAYREIVARIAKNFPLLVVIDSSSTLCDSINCFAKKDGKLLYNDTNHLSIDGVKSVGGNIIHYFR